MQHVENLRVAELMIDSCLESETFANHMRRRKRQYRSREQRCVQQTQCEESRGPPSRKWRKSFGGIRRFVNLRVPGCIESSRRANDDKENDRHAGDAADEYVQTRVLVLPRADSLFHVSRLEIK